MKNAEVRAALKERGLRYWELADRLGISPYTLSVWLRHELPPEKKRRILKVIEEVAGNAEARI